MIGEVRVGKGCRRCIYGVGIWTFRLDRVVNVVYVLEVDADRFAVHIR